MDCSNGLFFELIQLAIGCRTELSRIPTEEEWTDLMTLAERHALMGVCLVGALRVCHPEEDDYAGMSEDLFLSWTNAAVEIQQRNVRLNRACLWVQSWLAENGMRSSILKGQAIASLYGELAPYRQGGDIDVWVDGGMERSLTMVRSKVGSDCRYDYKHVHLPLASDIEVEIHYRGEVFMNLVKNCRVQRFWREQVDEILGGRFEVGMDAPLTTPTARLNAFYILMHCYRHMFGDGLGLRQVMDYYFVLMQPLTDDDRQWARQSIDRFGMRRFASGLMSVLHRVFGLPEEKMIVEPDVKEGDYLLREIMLNGSFGHHDERVKHPSHFGALDYPLKLIQHGMHLFSHYPSEFFWAPVWLVWHWVWKRTRRINKEKG